MKQLVVVAALVALPLVAFAGPKEKAEAQKHIEAATEAHQASNFEVALKELEAAFALDPQPDLLYAIGQVQVKLDNCPVAISYYERFLESKPGPEPAAAANEAIATCRNQLAAQPPPAEPEPAPPPTIQPTEPSPATPPQAEARRFDPIGTTLIGVGVVSTLVGVIFYSSAVSKLDDAEGAATYQESEEILDSAHSQRTLAVIFTGVGVAAIGVGAWHYLNFRKSEKSRVAVTPTTHGGMISWSGRF
jgi:tetratricopeptide (TPR) repeat protein